MGHALWPLFLIVGSNLVYQSTARSSSREANAFAILTVVYLVATLASFALYLVSGRSLGSLLGEVRAMNWANYLMGLAIIGLEGGFICLYRAGWSVSVGPVCTYTGVAIGLIAVGAFFYHEQITLRQVLGIVLCLGGIALVTLK